MKKTFLIIAFFVLAFLGLGNSYVSASCETENVSYANRLRGTHTFTCEIPSVVPSVCDGAGQICIQSSSCGGSYQCCICNQPAITPLTPLSSTGGISQSSSSVKCVGGTLTALGGCDCPTGTKNVDGVCTSCKAEGVCCGISLNTSIPFIGNCIEDSSANRGPGETSVTGATAFPVLMGSLTKILVTFILIISFVLIIIGGIMIATGNPSGGKKMIIKVVTGIALLGASGVILRLINPNFFG